MNYEEVIQNLESRTVMPKSMPGLEKMKWALSQVPELKFLNSCIITVAGTNGKGTTCAVLEGLLLGEKKSVGLYTSPHLISTTERIRYNGQNMTEADFVKYFLELKPILDQGELSHFESLTLIAAKYFSDRKCDYIIWEVGLGGTFDATNVFENQMSIITKLGLDHQNILGDTLPKIAENKFGIIKKNNLVIHHELPTEVMNLKKQVQEKTLSTWIPSEKGISVYQDQKWSLKSLWGEVELLIPGARAVENCMTALTAFKALGFDPVQGLSHIKKIFWPARMQKVNYPQIQCPVYLSGDHNEQGILSLLDILNQMSYQKIYFIVGIGKDKSSEQMLDHLFQISDSEVYLTVTPFKGLKISEYLDRHKAQAKMIDEDYKKIFKTLQSRVALNDLIVVTGSLYLTGQILREVTSLE